MLAYFQMEVWAPEGFGIAHILQEMLTYKYFWLVFSFVLFPLLSIRIAFQLKEKKSP